MTVTDIAVLMGLRPSVPFRDLLAAAQRRDVPVLIPGEVNDSTPELATLAEASGAAVQVASGDLLADARRLGVQSVVTFDEEYAYECLAATVTLDRTDAPRPDDKLDMRRVLFERGLTDVRAWPLRDRDAIEVLLRESGPVIVKPRRARPSRLSVSPPTWPGSQRHSTPPRRPSTQRSFGHTSPSARTPTGTPPTSRWTCSRAGGSLSSSSRTGSTQRSTSVRRLRFSPRGSMPRRAMSLSIVLDA